MEMNTAFTVTDFLAHVNDVLGRSWDASIAVQGEVSGYRVSRGSWVNFDLKDDENLVNIFMPIWNLHIPIEDGMRVLVYGKPRVYPKYGKFSLSADRVIPSGEGEIKKALHALRARLEKEGLMDPSRKRPLPRFPERIAFIGSKESAAYGDFVRILQERWGGVQIDVYHTLVQGDRAPGQLCKAIELANASEYDAIVMTRGGGSFDELMAFNDEALARAIHASKIPTLVAIGHERDVTLAEEVADVRASTPTDCARRLVPDRRDVLYELQTLTDSVLSHMSRAVEAREATLQRSISAPMLWLRSKGSAVAHLEERVERDFEHWFESLRERLSSSIRMLKSVDPKRVLSRGYSILRDAEGNGISSVRGLKTGQKISVDLADGSAGATITNVK